MGVSNATCDLLVAHLEKSLQMFLLHRKKKHIYIYVHKETVSAQARGKNVIHLIWIRIQCCPLD